MKKRIMFYPVVCLLFFAFFSPPQASSLTLYVDAKNGQDIPFGYDVGRPWGRSPEQPFKTITYALGKALPFRSTTIKVAPGTYNESVTIDKDQIWLKREGIGPVVIDGGGQDVISIDGARGVAITGFTVQNGNEGILGKGGASFTLNNTTVQDNADEGIQVDENSTAQLTDCTVQRSGDDGIGVLRNSSVTCTGSIVSSDNASEGLAVGLTSSAFFYGGTVTTNDNGGRGIQIGSSSSLSFFTSIVN